MHLKTTLMIKQLTILTFILTICLVSCRQTKSEAQNQEQKTSIYTIDTSVIAILSFDSTEYWLFKAGKPADLTAEDLLKIERILKKCIDDYNPNQERQFEEIKAKHPNYKLDKKNFIIDLTRYKRQYIATINSKNEKEVWVNCFCNTWKTDWKKNLIFVSDGGNCYFHLKINLVSELYYELSVNGDA
jgi:hypothetical protein